MRKSKPKAKPTATTRLERTFRSGKLRALQMIREFQRTDSQIIEQCDYDDEFRERGTPQRDIFAEYLNRPMSPQMLSGFTSFLTYWISFTEHAGTPNENWLDVVAKHPPVKAKEIWDRRETRRTTAQHHTPPEEVSHV
jgi:hypothetical protein